MKLEEIAKKEHFFGSRIKNIEAVRKDAMNILKIPENERTYALVLEAVSKDYKIVNYLNK